MACDTLIEVALLDPYRAPNDARIVRVPVVVAQTMIDQGQARALPVAPQSSALRSIGSGPGQTRWQFISR